MAMRILWLAALWVLACGAAGAQTPADPVFEVATVRPSAADATGLNIQIAPANFATRHTSLKDLIRFAYHTRSDSQIVGGPEWMDNRYFDIKAKAEPDTITALAKLPPEDRFKAVRSMTRGLLADRFKLRVTVEEQELPGYALVADKGGAKIEAAAPVAPGGPRSSLSSTGKNRLTARSIPIGMLVDWLARQPEVGKRLIVDETGLTSKYDFMLNGVTWGDAPDEGSLSIFTILKEQLGLVLKPEKIRATVYKIDSAELPSDN
jgi:uncharacterized protein (TIGR03435 family)